MQTNFLYIQKKGISNTKPMLNPEFRCTQTLTQQNMPTSFKPEKSLRSVVICKKNNFKNLSSITVQYMYVYMCFFL